MLILPLVMGTLGGRRDRRVGRVLSPSQVSPHISFIFSSADWLPQGHVTGHAQLCCLRSGVWSVVVIYVPTSSLASPSDEIERLEIAGVESDGRGSHDASR